MTVDHDALTALLADLYETCGGGRPDVDPEWGGLLLDVVTATLDPDELAGYPTTLRAFVQLHHDDLARMIREFGPDSAFAKHIWPYELVRTPHAIALCERLTVRPFALKHWWNETFESETPFDDLECAWGRG
ncbi:hypothetical protein [Catenuloplanes japonicus]|uniref:hypothetical protein n=1 Tax=Catenuloplanes japonicus TaxID=33876 RepID=UPI000AC7F8EB|nr:hypothetical protein [Catenuloplanes japonicus]